MGLGLGLGAAGFDPTLLAKAASRCLCLAAFCWSSRDLRWVVDGGRLAEGSAAVAFRFACRIAARLSTTTWGARGGCAAFCFLLTLAHSL